MRDKIRKAFLKEAENRKRMSKYESRTQPNLYQLDEFLLKSGYKLSDVIVHEQFTSPELIIDAIKPNHLHPDILHDMSEGTFLILVKKYGELEVQDVLEVIKGYENAIAVVEYLMDLDLSSLEVER